MAQSQNPIIMIPARMSSTRLPQKPLADIAGEPLIVHVWRRGMEADCGPVIVACAENEVANVIRSVGGEAVLTDPLHPSGSDRIHEAVERFDPDGKYDLVINLQGDLPTIDRVALEAVLKPLEGSDFDIGTLVAKISSPDERINPNVVKAVVSLPPDENIGPAIYFSRESVPWSEDDKAQLYHHIGLYAYRREGLRKFVSLAPNVLEKQERLEQLRALVNGMRIGAVCVDSVPLGVDTPADLELARRILSRNKGCI